jgi:phosphatidylserine decarboxylase
MEKLQYLDRATGKLCTEVIFMESQMRFLYENPLGFWLFDRWFNYPWICKLCAQWQSLPWSKRQIQPFMAQYQIDPAELAIPIADFPHFNAFFARQLRPGSRTFHADPQILLSPADGKILVYPQLAEAMRLPIKGIGLSLTALLESTALASLYQQGAAAIIRLAPADYHRFHFPTTGIADRARILKGRYYAIHPIALNQVPDAFCRNQRSITLLDSPTFGQILLMEVGAFCIGTIAQTYAPGQVEIGQEKGFFQFGGSTIVLLFEADRIQFDLDLVQNSQIHLETQIKAGEKIGQAIRP